nr:retrovirus-related Pol polyprotein from transposon TNT 1-94 [Tanacetum cinerariifolium]
MALALMAKAFKLNYSTPTNNNQRISSNPCNRQIAQPGMNMGQDRHIQMVGGNGGNQFRQYAGQNVGNLNGYNDVQNVKNQVIQHAVQNPRISNVRNQNGLIGVPGNANQNSNRNGNLEAARAEGNKTGHNGNQIRCYNCRGVGHFARNCIVIPRRRDVAYLQTQLLIAQKEEAGIQLQAEEFDLMAASADLDEIKEVNANCILMANLQQASTSGTQTDKSSVYDSDGSAEVHNYENCYDNEIFNMFTQEEQYTELLEPIPEPHQVPLNDNIVISEDSSVEQSGGTVEQHPANVEETRVLYDSLYNNLAIKVEKANTVNRKLKETNAELTTELAIYKNQEKCFKISQEKYEKLERCYQKSVYQEQCLSKKINALHLSSGVDNTKTKRPQSRSNTKNDRVPSASKSSRSKNKEVEVEEHHRKLLLSRNKKHMSSECNNVKLATQNVKSKVVCAMCKQCLNFVNHDVCLLNYVNGITSRGKKQTANVSINEKQKKQQPKVKKTKKLGSIERLALPKPSKPRSFLGKSKRASHPPKPVPNSRQRLHLLHMDLCGPMRIASINGKRYVLVIVDDYSRYTWVHFLRSKDEAPEVIKTFLKKITVLLHVGISHQMSSVRTPQQNEVVERRNRTLVEAARRMLIFSRALLYLWAEVIATACFTQNRSIIHRHFKKTPYELINGRKPDISFLHVFGAFCYPKNDHENIGKLGAKAMYKDYIGGQPSAVPRTVPAAQAHPVRQTSTTSTSIADTAPTPTNLSSQATIFPNSSQDVDELNSQQQHVQQQGNQALIQLEIIADNVPNTKDQPLEQVIGEPSRPVLTRNQLRYDGDMCMYALTVSTMEPKNVKEAMTDPAWIESMQEELLQFKRLDVWVLVPAPNNITPLTLKWLLKNKHDEEKTIIRNKSRLVVRGYRQEKGIDFEESFAPVYVDDIIFGSTHPSLTTGLWYTGLLYTKDFGFELTGFSDVDYTGCKDTFKSTSGRAQFLGEKLVSWSSKKQDCTALSTAEAEYVSLSACAIAISCNPVQHSKTKHIAVCYHFIKEHVEKGTIELYFVKTDYQLANLFTKALPADRFNYLVRRFGSGDGVTTSFQRSQDSRPHAQSTKIYSIRKLILSKSSAISDVQALPQKNMFNKIDDQCYQIYNPIYHNTSLASKREAVELTMDDDGDAIDGVESSGGGDGALYRIL